VDVLTDLDLNKMYESHLESKALATLAVRKRETSRYLLFDEQNILRGWENIKTGERILTQHSIELQRMAFSGIHILDPSIFNLFIESGRFSIIRAYLRLASTHCIKAFDHTGSLWFDVGTPAKLEEAKTIF
jgi:NDP-sugar pyrophosphorylase family protein